jgi:hypothetical protein
MTNYKNNIKIKNLNTNNLPLFEGYKEDKITKPVQQQKVSKAEEKSENLKNISTRTGSVADKTVNKPTKKPNPVKEPIKPRVSLSPTTANINNDSLLPLSLGIFLQEARVKAGYSMSQVSMITKLNIHYIEALERDDFKNTPPLIYVKAYVKKLSSLYKIDAAKALSLLTSSDNTDKKLSDSIFQDLQETKQHNQKDEEKIKVIFKISAIVFSIIILSFIILGGVFWFSDNNSNIADKPLTASEKAVTVKNMEKLIVPQSISLTELPVNPPKK